jgi:phosphodiesterase/alkaline phosphatase D-like protein
MRRVNTWRCACATAALMAAAWLGVAPEAQSRLRVQWVWSGGVTARTVVVKAKVLGTPSDLFLGYDIERQFRAPRRTPLETSARADGDGIATFNVDGLAPNTRYYYAVSDGPTQIATGEFHTFGDGPTSFAFAASACGGGNMFSAFSNHPIYTELENRRPLFFLHMGDLHYSNIGRNDVRLFQRAYDRVLAQRRQASLYRHVPIAYVWDDHDFGPNDSDRTAEGRAASRAAYDQYVPHYPLALEGGEVTTIQQAFTVGRVRFIMSDLRSERDPIDQPDGPDKSMLGLPQRRWLDEAFARAAADDAALVFWVSTVPWITRQGSKEDGWESYSWERQWVADRIEAHGLTRRLVVLAGDAHMVAIDDGSHSNYASGATPGEPAFPVFQAAPLDRAATLKGGPYSHGPSLKSNQFGWIEVEDRDGELRVTLSGRDAGGRQLPGLRLRLVCRARACTVER